MKPSIGAGMALLSMCVLLTPPTESLLILEILKIAQISFNSFSHTWDLFEAKLQPGPGSPYYQDKINPEEFVMKDHPTFFLKKDEMSLIHKINEINRKIANIQDKIRMHEEGVMRRLELIPHAIMTEMKVNQVLDVVRDVEALHERYTRYMKTGVTEIKKEGKPSLDRATIINFANFVTSHQPSTPLSVLDKLHAIMVPHLDSDRLLGTKSFFYTFKDYMGKTSPYQIKILFSGFSRFDERTKARVTASGCRRTEAVLVHPSRHVDSKHISLYTYLVNAT